MGHTTRAGTSSSPLATLVVAWMIVVGLALAPVGSYYYASGDIRPLLAFAAAAFLIGLALFIAMGLARLGARRRDDDEDAPIVDVRKTSVFGRK